MHDRIHGNSGGQEHRRSDTMGKNMPKPLVTPHPPSESLFTQYWTGLLRLCHLRTSPALQMLRLLAPVGFEVSAARPAPKADTRRSGDGKSSGRSGEIKLSELYAAVSALTATRNSETTQSTFLVLSRTRTILLCCSNSPWCRRYERLAIVVKPRILHAHL